MSRIAPLKLYISGAVHCATSGALTPLISGTFISPLSTALALSLSLSLSLGSSLGSSLSSGGVTGLKSKKGLDEVKAPNLPSNFLGPV